MTHRVTKKVMMECFFINTINLKGRTPITVCLEINGKGVQMEVDTGASITIMSENTYCGL